MEKTRQFSLGGINYCLLPYPQAEISAHISTELNKSDHKLIPFTVVTWNKTLITDLDVHIISERFSIEDDVWCPGFLSVVLLRQPRDLKCEVQTSITVVTISTSDLKLPNGPYVFCRATKQVYSVCRLYEDTHCAFVNGILPRTGMDDDFCCFDLCMKAACLDSGHSLPASSELQRIPVPSRLYSKPSKSKPLAGLRIAVKDVISLQGLKTGFGNNAWYELYPPETTTAPVIKLLLAAGVVIVGKTKTAEFGEGVDPHQWVGSVCPINPRGDGEQKPSSSSTGSAVAAAAYSWLDCTIGTDTGGSVRHPAGVNGLFGSRPTQNAMNLSGVLSATDLLNTVGIFARDATTFSKIGVQLLPQSFQPLIPRSARKYKLLYPTRSLCQDNPGQNLYQWFPHPLEDPTTLTPAEKHLEAFITKLEHTLHCRRHPISLPDLWRATKPRHSPTTLDEATGSIYSALVSYFSVHEQKRGGIDAFLSDHRAAHPGTAEPLMSDIVRKRHAYGRSLSIDDVAYHLDAMSVFASWVQDVLFGIPEEEEIALLVFPQSFGVPDPRDRYPAPGEEVVAFERFSVYAFGYLVGCPDYTVPVGEVEVERKEGMGEEKACYLPVSVSLVARRGGDGVLFDVLKEMEERGFLRGVGTGSRMYACFR